MSKYMEIVNYWLKKIENNEIRTEERMPTIRELAELFQCSKVTAVRAYAELQQRHIVFAVPLDGYYLVNNKKAEVGPKLINFVSTTPDETVLPYRESRSDLGISGRGSLTSTANRAIIIKLVEEAVASGARQQ